MKIYFKVLLIASMTICSASAAPPGSEYSAELSDHLKTALKSRGPAYRPRTEHLLENGQPIFTNRLILEDSPYLLQHAHNPVDWNAWGPEAFAKARRENKPVFLSIGYSTCHWCHVMERESFESIEIAEYLNTHFVSIKVDRERRPDIDTIYMTAVQMISGRGGWPMSSFLTADGKTFFGGTYFPPARFLNLLKQVTKAWHEDPAGLVAKADEIATRVQRYVDQAATAGTLSSEAPELAIQKLLQRHDSDHGGFGPAPKFPNESDYLFLLDSAMRKPQPVLLELFQFDLKTMAGGGIYDQIGGGFHRYSTDDNWLVPHFEKMLYNQAQLARVYLDAAALTGQREFSRVAGQTLDYLLRDMQSPGGGFYSATDADSGGGEGRFFLWTPTQLQAVLSEQDAEMAMSIFNVEEGGNFEGASILHLSDVVDAEAGSELVQNAMFSGRLDNIRQQLYIAREQREHPGRDEKILTAWNAMVIQALAQAGQLAGGEAYSEAALEAAQFIWRNHRDSNGKLYRISLEGRASVAAVQEDYAWLADAYISLYDLSDDPVWLERARTLLDSMHALFWDNRTGGYYMNVDRADTESTPLMGRPKDIHDRAVPSGNAVALNALVRLAHRPGSSDEFLQTTARINALLSALAQAVNRNPSAFTYLLRAAQSYLHGETGALQYGAHGGVRAKAKIDAGILSVDLNIQPGWHINANEPLSADLIPTILTTDGSAPAWQLENVSYPRAIRKTLGFQSEELALYEGNVQLTATLANTQDDTPALPLLRVKIRLQACDDRICLPPEDVIMQVPVQ
jgi:uncharacterized protein YyaL (SSP411 family)